MSLSLRRVPMFVGDVLFSIILACRLDFSPFSVATHRPACQVYGTQSPSTLLFHGSFRLPPLALSIRLFSSKDENTPLNLFSSFPVFRILCFHVRRPLVVVYSSLHIYRLGLAPSNALTHALTVLKGIWTFRHKLGMDIGLTLDFYSSGLNLGKDEV